MALRNKAFHQLRQLFQQHTARWQHELPDLTKPQYAVMRAIAEHPGIEQVALIEAATLEDVGREIGLTRERVRQIQVEGLRRLREILQTQGLNIEALFRE